MGFPAQNYNGCGGAKGPVTLPAFKAGDSGSAGMVGSTPTRFRHPRKKQSQLQIKEIYKLSAPSVWTTCVAACEDSLYTLRTY